MNDYPDLFWELPHLGYPWGQRCRVCERVSFNVADVRNHYCGYCHQFLDDIWPPARQAVLDTVAHWRKDV